MRISRACTLQSLLKDGRVLIAAVINSSSLLLHEIRGFRSLIPAFMFAISRILSKVRWLAVFCRCQKTVLAGWLNMPG